MLCKEGYQGSESGLRHYISEQRKVRRRPPVYLPLSFEPGVDAQVDWGEAVVKINGEQLQAQIFVLRLSYSRKIFVMAFQTKNKNHS